MGGIASVIWSALPVLMKWYSTFQYESTLIRHLFTETAYEHVDNNPINLKRVVNQYKPFRYGVREFVVMVLFYYATCCNCCCRDTCARDRKKRFTKY